MDHRFVVRSSSRCSQDVVKIVIDAPRVAKYARAGQFVIVRATEDAERIPLTISQADPSQETITLVVQAVGRSTNAMIGLAPGDHFADVLGPLGKPTEIDRYGVCVVVAGGVGVAIALPVAKAFRDAGNRVVSVVGARTADQVILLEEMRSASSSVIVTTEDGSMGVEGLVTDALTGILDAEDVARVFTVGPVPMMQAVADLTRTGAIPTVASLNPIMVDGTGMCGGCRVSVAGTTRFACVDGPEFDAHDVDFPSLVMRNRAYRAFETCQLDLVDEPADG